MDLPPNAKQTNSQSSAWYKIAAVLLLVVMAFLFFEIASARMRHKSYDEAPPAGSVPGKPGEVIAH